MKTICVALHNVSYLWTKATIWVLTPSFSFHIRKENIFIISQNEQSNGGYFCKRTNTTFDVKFKQRDVNLRFLLIHLTKVNYCLTAYQTVNIDSYKPKKKETFNQVWRIAKKNEYMKFHVSIFSSSKISKMNTWRYTWHYRFIKSTFILQYAKV